MQANNNDTWGVIMKFKRIFAVIFSLVFLFSGCGNQNKQQLESLTKELAETKSSLEVSQKDVLRLQEALNKQQATNQELLKLLAKDKPAADTNINGMLSVNGIRLGYSKTQVLDSLGDNYTESGWNFYESVQKIWEYSNGLKIYFVDDVVYSIVATGSGIAMDIQVYIGMDAKDALEIAKSVLTPYVSIHSLDNKPNLGWFSSKNDEMLILQFNKAEDRFNENVDINNAKVEIIELHYVNSFD